MCDHQEMHHKRGRTSATKSQQMRHQNQGHHRHHNQHKTHQSDDTYNQDTHSTEDSVHQPDHRRQSVNDETHHPYSQRNHHKQNHRHVSLSEATGSSSASSSSHSSSASSSSLSSRSSSSSSSSSSISSSSVSSSSLSSDTSSERWDKCLLKKPQHSQSCTDISGKHRYNEDGDDTAPLIERGSIRNRLSVKQQRERNTSPTNSKKAQRIVRGARDNGSVRKSKSMEALSRPKDREAHVNENEESGTSQTRKNLTKEKKKFSAFLNEITRQVLSPMRLTTLGVTDTQRPCSPRPVSPRASKMSGPEQQRQQRSRPASADSVTSSRNSHTSKISTHLSNSESLQHHRPKSCIDISCPKKTHTCSQTEQCHTRSYHHHRHQEDHTSSHHYPRYEECNSPSPKHHHNPNHAHHHGRGRHHHRHHHSDRHSPVHHNTFRHHRGHRNQAHHHRDEDCCSPTYLHGQRHSASHHPHGDHHSPAHHHHHHGEEQRGHAHHHNHGRSHSHQHEEDYSTRHHTTQHADAPSHYHEAHSSGHHYHSNHPNTDFPSVPHHHRHHSQSSDQLDHHAPKHSHHHRDHPNSPHHHHHGDGHDTHNHSGVHHGEGHDSHHLDHLGEGHHHHHGDHRSESHHHHHRDHHSETHHHQDHHSSSHQHCHGDLDSKEHQHQHPGEHHGSGHQHHHRDHHSPSPADHHNDSHQHPHGDHHLPAHHHQHADHHSPSHQHPNTAPQSQSQFKHHHGEHHSESHQNKVDHSELYKYHQREHHSTGLHHGDHQVDTQKLHHGEHQGPSNPHGDYNATSPEKGLLNHPCSKDQNYEHSENDTHLKVLSADSPPSHMNSESRSSKVESPRPTRSPSVLEEERTSFTDSSVHKQKAHELGRIMVLQEKNEGLHQSLLKTAVRMECLGEEFVNSQKLLETELQKTRMELSNLTDRFKRLHDSCSSTQQTNNLLQQKLQSVTHSMEGERERLNRRISALMEQLSGDKSANSVEMFMATSILPNPNIHFESEDIGNQLVLPITPPPAEFMDSLNYGSTKAGGQEQALGSVPEEEESDWSEMGEEIPQFILMGSSRNHSWRHQQDVDKDSESGGEGTIRLPSAKHRQIPHLQILPSMQCNTCPSDFQNLSDGSTAEGNYRITSSPNLVSSVLIRSASLEEIPLARQHMQKELRGTEAMIDLHSPGNAITEDLDNEIIHHLRTNSDREAAMGMSDSGLASLQMLNHFIHESQSNEGKGHCMAELHGWMGGIPDEVLEGERTQL